MPRARSLKPGFFKNEKLAELGPYAMILFAGLWVLADRCGRLEYRPRRIKAEVFPYFNDQSVETLVDLLHKYGFIVKYTVAEEEYISIPNWFKHQNPHHREADSIIPAPVKPRASPRLASGQPQASPGLSPTFSGTSPRPGPTFSGPSRADSGLLTPDTLTPDSGYLDSLNPEPDAAAVGVGSAEVCETKTATTTTTAAKPWFSEDEPDLGQVARDTVAAIMPAHPKPGNAPLAVSNLERILAEAVDPVGTARLIRENHAAWVRYWRANPRVFRPMAHFWLSSGDWVHPPPSDAPQGNQTLAERLLAEVPDAD